MADWSPVDLLPGLWVGLLGAFLAAALRRWFDPVPWRILAVFAAVLLILFGAVLFGGKVLLPLDGLRGYVPFQGLPPTQPQGNFLQGDLIQLVAPSLAAVRTAWGEGRWPLWSAQVGAGMPLLADPQAQAFQPLALLGGPLPLARAAGVTVTLRVLVALAFAFLWMRRQGLGEAPALAGALAYGLGGFLLLWVGWPIANPAALLPLVLYGVTRCDEPGGRRDALLLALGLLVLLLGGHPETILYALGVALLFLLDRVRRRPRGLRGALLARAGMALLVAGMVAAPAWLPFLEYLPKTMRAARVVAGPKGRQHVAWGASPRNTEPKHPQSSEGAAAAPWFSGLPPLRGLKSLGATDTWGSRPRLHAAGPSGLREGGTSFIENLSRRLLPIAAPNAYGNSRFVHYWGLANTNEDAGGFVGTAALLAALLAVRARRRFPQEKLALGIAVLCLLLLAPWPGGSAPGSRRLLMPFSLCLSYLGACTLERFRLGEVRRRPLLIAALGLGLVLVWGYLAHPHPGDPRTLEVFRFGWLRWQLRFLVLAALLLVIAVSWQRRGRSLAVTGVAAAVAAELLLAHGPANPPMPRRLAFPVPGSVQFLQQTLGQDPRAGPRFRVAALGRAFPPNLAALYGLTDARLYNPMAPQAYVERTTPIAVGWRGEIPEWGKPRHRLYGRLGVLFVLADPDAVFPARNFERVYAGPDASVWKCLEAKPRLFLATLQGVRRMTIPRLEDSWITVTVRLRRGQGLSSSIYQDGGWLVLTNRRPRPAILEQGVFLATRLPAGRRRIDMLYRPPAFLWGCVLAALGLAAGAAAFVPSPPAPTSHPGSTVRSREFDGEPSGGWL